MYTSSYTGAQVDEKLGQVKAMGASGTNHSAGLVPDPGSTAGTTKFLREDGTWNVPPAGGADNTYYCTCGTAAATATKVITPTLESGRTFELKYGTIIGVDFTYTNTATTPKFNVGDTGEKNVYVGLSPIAPLTFSDDLSIGGDGRGTICYYMYGINGWYYIGKSGMNYKDILYYMTTSAYNNATSGTVTIDGTKAITVLTVTGNISSLSIGNTADMPANHSAHVILTASSAYTVAIAHNATTSVCPDGTDPDPLEIPAGGYVEVDFLKANSKIYVRGV